MPDKYRDTPEIMNLRIAIVAEHASARFGGEAVLALHYFRVLRKRNIPTWLVVHERTRQELESLLPDDKDRIFYARDTIWHRLVWQIGRPLPSGLASFTTSFLIRLLTQKQQREVLRRLVREKQISVIHQPMPVSPREPSLIFDLGAPVIIGPMNGNMDYPPAFQKMQGSMEKLSLIAGRRLADFMNWLIPGKRKARILLVANSRTRNALPAGTCPHVLTLVENGVDLSLWKPSGEEEPSSPSYTRFIFIGRLIALKAVDLLLLAFKEAAEKAPMSLTIIGDDVERLPLMNMAHELGILADPNDEQPGKVRFLGWLSQIECAEQLRKSDALVLPSLRECGGAVVLEAMALNKAVIATNWGGPADYLDPSCGILVNPESRDALIKGLSEAIVYLAVSPLVRITMGKAGRQKVVNEFDWEVKADNILAIYQQAENTKNHL